MNLQTAVATYILQLSEAYQSARAQAGLPHIKLITISKMVSGNGRWIEHVIKGGPCKVQTLDQVIRRFGEIWPQEVGPPPPPPQLRW